MPDDSMTAADKRELAKAKGVSVATIARWIRQHGAAVARGMSKTSTAEAGRKSRRDNPGYGARWWRGG